MTAFSVPHGTGISNELDSGHAAFALLLDETRTTQSELSCWDASPAVQHHRCGAARPKLKTCFIYTDALVMTRFMLMLRGITTCGAGLRTVKNRGSHVDARRWWG